MSIALPVGSTINQTDLEPRAYARTMRRILVLLIGVGVAIRIVRLIIPSPIWGDEAMLALNFQERDYAGLTQYLDYAQVAPVLFLWAERFVLVNIGPEDWAIRLVPFLASIGGLFFFWDFARRTVTPTAAAIAVGLMAMSVWPVSMAATVKPYAGDLFWSALLLSLAARWHQRPERLWPLILLAATVPIALGSSYPAVFVAGGVSLYLLPVAWRAKRSWQVWFVLYNLAMLASFAAIFATVGRSQVDPAKGTTGAFMRTYWSNGFPPESASDWPLWLLETNTGRMFAYPFGDARGGSSATTLLFIAGMWWCWRNGSRPLLIVCLVPFALNLAAAILGKYPYAGCCRLSQHLAPAICLLAGVGWAYALERYAPLRTDRLRHMQRIAGLLLVIGIVGLVYRCVKIDHDPYARYSSHLYNELSLEIQQGDRILVRNLGSVDANLQWYIKRFGDRVTDLRDGESIPPAERLWVVTWSVGRAPRESHQRLIDAAKGWNEQETFTYIIRPDTANRDTIWQYVLITCLIRPGDARPAALLNVSP
jgi:hypothetical protein